MNPIIAPSILSCDFSCLGQEIQMINESKAELIHVDVMDGVFVPNISLGLPIVSAIRDHAEKPLDVHLMIVEPENYIEAFKEAGAHILTVHLEASRHLHRTLQQIRKLGMKAGVAINPHTSVNQLSEILYDVDVICLMSVNPGFGGQSFIPRTFQKITQLSQMRKEAEATFLIEIDGGVNEKNTADLIRHGADVLVAGNAVFKSENPKETTAKLLKLAMQAKS